MQKIESRRIELCIHNSMTVTGVVLRSNESQMLGIYWELITSKTQRSQNYYL